MADKRNHGILEAKYRGILPGNRPKIKYSSEISSAYKSMATIQPVVQCILRPLIV